MSPLARYLEVLDNSGGRREELDTRDRWALTQRWREVYAARLHAATGKWQWLGFDWHIFSYEYAPAHRGRKAVACYLEQAASPLLVVPEEGPGCVALPAFRVSEPCLPRFEELWLDLHVWPEDLTWTMAFTHEGNCGPYFSRREWLGF